MKQIAYAFSISAIILINAAILYPGGITYKEANPLMQATETAMSLYSVYYLITHIR